jgi:cellulose synthase/poly-beta-1,6-N-acetylglucosamine synthase-like glycosyltransferase
MIETIYIAIYTIAVLGLGVFGVQHLLLSILFLIHFRRPTPKPSEPDVWPPVTVQLPIYNEQFVVERLIDAVCAIDYPRDLFSIQVLDDSTDGTTELARGRVAFHRRRGIDIELIRRKDRAGYKGGALAHGLRTARGELIAVFDADFVPPSDFLRRLAPHFGSDEHIGMVQARWGHTNAGYNLITRGQALTLDGQFVIMQWARSRSGLLLKFNGSAGIWRRACIEDCGGWSGDTLTEDLDLSYRAQMRGWRMIYAPDVVVQGEIPPQWAAFKRQHYRWAYGSVQVLRKLGGQLWRAPLSLQQIVDGYVHLAAYFAYALALLSLFIALPLVLARGVGLPSIRLIPLAGFFPPILFALSQWAVYADWKRRFAYFPILICLGVGMMLNNTLAVLAAMRKQPMHFARTPKFCLESRDDDWFGKSYALRIDWTVWAELLLAAYAFITMLLAAARLPALVPVLAVFAIGFGFTGFTGLWQSRATHVTSE